MSLNTSSRTNLLIKLAVQNKFAVVDEQLTVVSISDTLREAGMESPKSHHEQIHSPSFHSKDDFSFNARNDQNFTTTMTSQDENVLPDYTKDRISPLTSQNENQSPGYTSAIAPIHSQINDDVPVENNGQQPEDENVLLDISNNYVAPITSKTKNNSPSDDIQNYKATNDQYFTTTMTSQDEYVLPDYTKDCISPLTSLNENQSPGYTSAIAPIHSQINDDVPVENNGQQPEDKNVLLDISNNYVAPMTSKTKNNSSSDDLQNYKATNDQYFTTTMTSQDENVLPDYTKDYISALTSQNENKSPGYTSDYIAPILSQINDDVPVENHGQQPEDENVLLDISNKCVAPMTNKTKNNSSSDDLQNYNDTTFKINILDSYSDFSDFESSGSEYCPSTASVSSDTSECYDHASSSRLPLNKDKGNLLENYQVGETKNKYSRKKQLLENFIEPANVVPVSVDAASQPSTSKHVPKQNQGNDTDKPNFKIETQPNLYPEFHNKYLKAPSARERPTICPFCFDDVITHFPRHLLRHHADREEVKKIKELGPKNKERISLILGLRKQGYFHLKVEKNINNPIRNSKNPNTNYAVCQYCLGDYSKSLLYKHVKQCKSKPADVLKPGINCLSNFQTFMASLTIKNDTLLRSLRIREEVFTTMMADDISLTAKSDVLICLYGEILLAKHKRAQISTLISSKIREMARMLIALKSLHPNISNLFDALKPNLFSSFVLAAKNISGYDPQNKTFRAPSLALHMGTNLKIVCNVAYKVVLERKQHPTITWENFETKREEIKDLKKLIEGHWCNEISSLALKTLKERNWEKPIELPLANDILLFQNHIYEQAENAYAQLMQDLNQPKPYRILAECVLAHTIMFNRKRVGDVQYLTIETYSKEIHNTEQEAFTQSLTEVEKLLSQRFKRVVTGGKGSKPIAILFGQKMQKYINCLLEIRKMTTMVPKSNAYLFANPRSEAKWMIGVKVIGNLAKNCGAERPTLLTSTKFRKHIATTLQLMNMQPDEMEQLATFMGHTQKTHAEFYRLPQDVYQTAKVAKVLLLLEKGKGQSLKGKTVNEIQLEKDIYYSSNSSEDEDDDGYDNNKGVKKLCKRKTITKLVKKKGGNSREQNATELHVSEEIAQENNGKKNDLGNESLVDSTQSNSGDDTDPKSQATPNIKRKKLPKNPKANKIVGRIRWTQKEKDIVNEYFAKHIHKKITPKKYECDQFLVKHGKELQNKDWVRVKTLVYNTFRM